MISNKKALVPKLRFPNFRDAGGWQIKKLGDPNVSYFVKERISQKNLTLETYVSTENILSDFGGIMSASKLPASGSFTSYRKGDILIANIRPYLKKISVAKKSGGASNDVVVVRPKAKVETLFLASLLKNDVFINYVMSGAKGVKMPRGDISLMKEYPLAIPNQEEQQKIADCLSTLDKMIAAQAEKIDVLKIHKKGLMQQLFPRKDETVPRLRFSEFREENEWKKKKFGQLCHFVRGPFGGALKKEIFVDDGYAVYEQSHAIYRDFSTFRYFISKEKYEELNRFSVLPGDILMSCSGTMGKFAVVPQEFKQGVINQALLKLTVNKGYHIGFVKFSLELPINQEKLLSQSAGGAIKNVVGVSQMKEISLFVPSNIEQQKIADCLSSLDELIVAQTEKLDILKTHKKGLMQLLFPSPETVAV